jgi:predicted ribosome quality control (RQC) complex YloA/Tae2 family protein
MNEPESRIAGIVMDAEAMKAIERGKASYIALKSDKNWLWWVDVGEAIERGRNQIMIALCNPNNPQDKKLRDAMGAFLKETGFDKVHKTVRTRLKLCMDHIDGITLWRATLSEDERQAWNHPKIQWEHYKTTLEDVIKAKRTKPTPNEIIMELQEELDAKDERIRELEEAGTEANDPAEELTARLDVVEAERDDWRTRAEKAEWGFAELKAAAKRMMEKQAVWEKRAKDAEAKVAELSPGLHITTAAINRTAAKMRAAAAASAAAGDAAPDVETAAAETPPKRGRGRPRKAKPETTAVDDAPTAP